MKPEVTIPAFRRLSIILSFALGLLVSAFGQPAPSITGDTVVCPGDSRFYATDFVQGNSWTWATSPGGVIIQNFGNFVEVKWTGGSNTNQWISVTETDTNNVSVTVQQTVLIKSTNLSCNDKVYVSLDQTGHALINPDMLLEGNYNTYEGYTVVVTTSWGAYVGDLLDCSHIGLPLTGKVIVDCTGNSCWGTIFVEDKSAPKWQCPPDTVDIACETDIDSLPHPPVMDNCDQDPLISLTGITIDNDDICQGVNIVRYWVATDEYGNKSTCTEHLRIPADGGVVFPQDRFWQCVDYYNHPNIVEPTPYTGDLQTTGSGIVQGVNGVYCQYTAVHQDELLENCGNTFKIIRTWTVINWCNNEIITQDGLGNDNEQIIKLIDTIPPIISVEDLTVNANLAGPNAIFCASTGQLPAPVVSDECGEVTVQIFTPVGEANYTNGDDGKNGGHIPSPGLHIGAHNVVYKVTDACGNSTLDTITVTVADLTPPTAICDEITTTTLDVFGHAEVFANTFDDGSHDNCCISNFLARRMDEPFADFSPSVVFDCDDEEVQVVVRIYDCFDNYGECMVLVHVQDKIAPSCIAPPDKNINCNELPPDITEAWIQSHGEAATYDNCGAQLVELPYQQALDGCGGGTILRQWIAVDSSSNISGTCSQTLNIIPVSDWIIHFPPNFTGGCGDSLAADSLSIENFGCDQFAVSVQDQYFSISNDTVCFKIVRTYKVINWCYYDPYQDPVKVPTDPQGAWIDETFSNYHGAFEYQQIIKIHDDTPPVLSYPFTHEFCSYDSLCETGNVFVPVMIEGECSDYFDIVYHLDINADYTIDQSGEGFFDGVLPMGPHKIHYSIQDGCGNESVIDIDFSVVDCKAPVPICKNGLIVEIMQNGMVEICASDFDDKSFDNCSSQLYFSYSQDIADSCHTFFCDDTFQEIPVEIWLSDESGNQDHCETFLVVQDNMFHCDTGVPLSGQVATETDKAVEGVGLMLNSQNGDLNAITDPSGFYQFMALETGIDYSVTPSKDDDLLNGVSTYDLVLISRHILGVTQLDSPYKIIAADVNKSKSVTTLDLVFLRKAILYVNNEFPNNKSWRFVDKDFVFPNPQNPWQTEFPEVINLNNLSAAINDADFVAIKVGDVNGSATTNLSDEDITDRSSGKWTLLAEDRSFDAEELVTLQVEPEESTPLAGYQLALEYDTHKLLLNDIEVTGTKAAENFAFNEVRPGLILMNWYDSGSNGDEQTGLPKLQFEAIASGQLSASIRVVDNYLKPEVYTKAGNSGGYEVKEIGLSFNSPTASQAATVSLENIPNPFTTATRLQFNTTTNGPVKFYITDLNGKLVWSFEDHYESGTHELLLADEDLPGQGVYICRMLTESGHTSIKLVKVTQP